jgi:hypothetical protein
MGKSKFIEFENGETGEEQSEKHAHHNLDHGLALLIESPTGHACIIRSGFMLFR